MEKKINSSVIVFFLGAILIFVGLSCDLFTMITTEDLLFKKMKIAEAFDFKLCGYLDSPFNACPKVLIGCVVVACICQIMQFTKIEFNFKSIKNIAMILSVCVFVALFIGVKKEAGNSELQIAIGSYLIGIGLIMGIISCFTDKKAAKVEATKVTE